MNRTENYQLPKWEKSDRVMMEDFNGMTDRLDEVLKELADAAAKGGNVRYWTTSWAGDGGRRSFVMPDIPLILFIVGNDGSFAALHPSQMKSGWLSPAGGGVMEWTWLGNAVAWDGNTLNAPGSIYYAVALYKA